MADLGITFSTLYQRVSEMLGTGSSPSGTKLTLVKQYVNDGYARFLRATKGYRWTFLQPSDTLVLWGSQTGNTCDATETGGVMTITGDTGSFAETMVGKDIVLSGTTTVEIASYTNSYTITAAGSTSFTGATYSITADGVYDLPSDVGNIKTALVYEANQSRLKIVRTSEENIRTIIAGSGSSTGKPRYWSFKPKTYVTTTGQRYQIHTWPTLGGNDELTMNFTYDVLPSSMTAEAEYPRGGAWHSHTILEACLAEAEAHSDDNQGLHEARFKTMLEESIDLDVSLKPANLGYNGDNSASYRFERGTATYEANQ